MWSAAYPESLYFACTTAAKLKSRDYLVLECLMIWKQQHRIVSCTTFSCLAFFKRDKFLSKCNNKDAWG